MITILELSIVVILVVWAVCMIICFCNLDKDWSGKVAFLSSIIALIGLIAIGIYISKQPVSVKTKQDPQIDTTITIKNGVADTAYTYHLIRK